MPSKPITAPQLAQLKRTGTKIVVLTAYDFPTARLLDPHVDVLLVGDSLGTVVQGHKTTIPVTLDQMIYHGEMVARAAERALVVVDLPFPLAQLGPTAAIEAAGRILKESGAPAVKIEGGADRAETVAAVVRAGIPVMGHCGLLPQHIHAMGGYRLERDEAKLLADARAIQAAGAFAIVLECTPAEIARRVSEQLAVPTIGIGAGAGCDGQVLVLHDMLGLNTGYIPKHAKRYADLAATVSEAVKRYAEEVRDGSFPSDENTLG